MACKYHPNANAIDKCEDCHKSICLDCKRTFRINHSGNNNSQGYVETITVCPVCYCGRVQNKSIGGHLFQVIFGIVFALGPVMMMGGVGNMPPFFILFISIFVIAGLSLAGKGIKDIIVLPGEKHKAQKECDEFLDSLKYKAPKKQGSYYQHRKQGYLFCQQCGNKMDFNAEFCPACGDPTDDERRLLK